MKKTFRLATALLALLALTNFRLWAQVPSGYYDAAYSKTGLELRAALHDIIDNHTTISYGNIWNAFWSTDNKGDGVVWDMYSDIPNGTPPYTFSIGQNQCGEYVQEGDCYNREHSWPQSWFSGDEQTVPGRDLHHVFPTDGFVNLQRSSYPYGEVSNASWTSQNGSKLGTCKSSLGYSGIVFEPIDEYKGDFARAMMYMSVRYYGEDSEWGSSDMTDKSDILPWAIAMLMDWNEQDPVSQKEINRNNVIYSDYQHNRNPFIDHPEYARMIWDPNWHGGIGGYEKVTSSDEITDGEYLIVYEGGSLAFDGSLTALDATNNTIEVSIFENNIESNATTDASAFTITAITGGYSIKSASGYYIGQTSNANGLLSSTTTAYTNTISVNEGNVDIISSGCAYLRYNASSDQTRFRYYKSSSYTNQKAIQLYKKIMVYSVNLADVEHGSISADAEEAVEGTTITLTATPEAGYELDHWTVTDAQNNAIEVMNNQFVMPASNVSVSAVFVYVGVFSQQYHLVSDVNQLVAGRTYLIVNTAAGQALSVTQNNNNRSGVAVTITNEVISSIGSMVCELTLGGSAGEWTHYDSCYNNNTGGYLYAVGGGNYLRTKSNLDDKGKWSIGISNGVATIVSNGNVNQNNMRYNPNSNNPIFSCYASSSTMAKVELYIRSEEYDHTESETIPHLYSFDKHTVRSGATLTVSGTATCNDATHLILEDGAQLVHHSDNVMATVKKSIQGYNTNGGWYTLATPFSTYSPANTTMVSDDYDFYAYDEDGDNEGKEWCNYKAGSFNLVAGQGYLYAHNPSTILRMTGTLNNGDYSNTVSLSYGNTDENLKGFNLLGNPTAHSIAFTKTDNVADGYYYLSNSENWIYETGNTVPVGRGFMVKANATGQTVTLNPQSKGNEADKGQYLCLNVGEEKAYIKMNEGVSMPLLDLKGQQASLYLTGDGQPYVMLVRDGATYLDLNFKPRRCGEQTLRVDTQGLALDYLHLIDNLTGADIDLLVTPEYTFNATPTDYAARFQLVFSASINEDDNLPFAYFSDGQIIVTYEGEATLQVIDVLGRVVDKNNLTPGIYVLRLITDDALHVQKIKVR